MRSLTPISGTTSLQIAFLTAFTQLIPTHTVTLFRGIISLRVPRFPLLFILAVFILNVVGLYNFAHLQLALNGFLVSWTYLRFFKPAFPDLDTNQSPALRGDASETFAFASFFPEVTRPAISGMADTIFNILVQLKICTPFSSADMQASRGESHHHRTVGSSRAETERRRALALKALDQRLNDAAKRSPQPQPPAAGQGQGSVGAQPKVEPPKMEAPGQMLGETRYELEHDKGSAQV